MNILRLIYDWPPPWDGLAPAPFEISRAQAEPFFVGGEASSKLKVKR